MRSAQAAETMMRGEGWRVPRLAWKFERAYLLGNGVVPSNDPDQRRRANDARHGTDTQSRCSLHPVVGQMCIHDTQIIRSRTEAPEKERSPSCGVQASPKASS